MKKYSNGIYNLLETKQMEQTLNDRLKRADANKTLAAHPEVNRIQKNVEFTVKQILERVQNTDSRFENKLLCVGSYYDGLKVGLPDEFDYLVELTKLVEEETFEVRPSGFRGRRNLWRTSKGHPGFRKVDVKCQSEFCKICLETKNDKYELLTHVGTKQQPEYVLNTLEIKNLFYYHVIDSLEDIKNTSLPKYMEVLDETTSIHGPAVTLKLLWNGRFFKRLKISVDMTICLKVMKWEKCLNFLDRINARSLIRNPLEFNLKRFGCHLTPFIIEEPTSLKRNISHLSNTKWRVSTSYIENQIMCLIHANSDIKLLIRGLKIARDSELLLSTKLPPLLLMEDSSLVSNSELDRNLYRLSDIIPSYLIKTIAFLVIAEIPGDELKLIPPANLFIFMLCNLYRMIADDCMENFFVKRLKLNTPEIEDIVPGFYNLFQNLSTQDIVYDNNIKRFTKTEICCSERIDFKPESLEKLLLETKSNVQDWHDLLWD